MNLFHILCLMLLGLMSITCAPVDNNTTFYDAIVQKCSSVTLLPHFKDQDLFKTCNNWKKISEVRNLTTDNKMEVLCWLYFNAFTQYCNHTQQVNIPEPSDTKTVKLSAVCDKLEVIPKQLESTNSLHNIIKTPDDCKKICKDEVGWPESFCSISYYYNLQNGSSIKNFSHLIHVQTHVPPMVEENNKLGKAQPSKTQDKVVSAIKGTDDQNIKQTAEDNNESLNQNTEPHFQHDESNIAQSKPKADQSNSSKSQAVTTPTQPPPIKDVASAVNKVEPSVDQSTNLDDNIGDKNKKQDSNTGIETGNDAPAHPQMVDVVHNIEEVPVDRNPIDKTPDNIDLTNDQDSGPGEDVMQPNDRPESEEDIQEQSDIMPHEKPKPGETEAVNYTTEMDGDSYFFTYFMLLCVIFIVGYVCYHNKQKILALILEGRRGKRQYRGRRPNSANYHKLDSNLEEAITSSCNKNTNNVIY